MAERRLFGTDGVRGPVGEFLTAELAMALGRAAASAIDAGRPRVLIVRDTRESGPMLEAALAAGIAEGGGDAMTAGVLPTPAASVLARRLDFDLAAVVSASHNPYGDNGIKFFDRSGTKLDDEMEASIEARLEDPAGAEAGRVDELGGAFDDYIRELRTAFGDLDLSGRTIALDCANGATYRVAPAIFERLGATVLASATEPDGRNINDGCGAIHTQPLAERVGASEAEIGFAFDGDGDRLIAIDGEGGVHDGDELIALAARHLSAAGELAGGVAVTVMTNYGFHAAMQAEGIEVAQTKVGDRYVSEALRERDWTLGGEQSGHIIWTGFTPSGDGIAAALLTLRALGDRRLGQVEAFERLPQRMQNVRIADRSAVARAEALWAAVEEENGKLEGRGRVLVRPSGTEPLLRVMVEAPSDGECEQVCSRLVAMVETEFG
ncbi:MAG: phosphoglucosamine mutase [Actinobacteria bacterium]|nr:phosphoglucosamine mutase [Actinomycetota bacterium]